MNPQDAIKSIRNHMKVHHIGEYPHIQIADALDLALYALSQLIPVRPFEDDQGDYICNTVNCNTYLDKFAPYCPMCGRPICWKEGNE